MKSVTEMRAAKQMEIEICEVVSKMKYAMEEVTKMEPVTGDAYGSSF